MNAPSFGPFVTFSFGDTNPGLFPARGLLGSENPMGWKKDTSNVLKLRTLITAGIFFQDRGRPRITMWYYKSQRQLAWLVPRHMPFIQVSTVQGDVMLGAFVRCVS